jgi:uncharacterized alpha/beta hydrolase family protein
MKKPIILIIILLIILALTLILILTQTSTFEKQKTSSSENIIQSSPSSYEESQIIPSSQVKTSCSCNS